MILVLLLAGCASPEPVIFDLRQEAVQIRENCLGYGFVPGSDNYAFCLMQGAEQTSLRRERAMEIIYNAGGHCVSRDYAVLCGFGAL